MKTLSLDNLYIHLERHIHLVESHLEVKGIAAAIRTSRLKPYSYFFGNKSDKLVLFDRWFDEFGNTLEISKKKVSIVYNDLSLSRDKIIITDLYHGLSMNRVAKISKLAYLLIGKDEDLYRDCYTLALLGLDNYLRVYVYLYGQWNQVSPLLLGVEMLIRIVDNASITYFRELEDNKEKSLVPCLSTKSWLISLPVGVSFMSQIKDHEQLTSILGNA